MWMSNKKPLVTLYVLNLLDLIFTYIGLRLMFIEEANPIMAYFYEVSPLSFILIKIIVVFLGIFAISRIYNKSWVKHSVSILNLIYVLIFVLHIKNYSLFITHI